MKEFIEKLIGRLEEYCKPDCNGCCSHCHFSSALGIVNQLAEEYNNDFASGNMMEQCTIDALIQKHFSQEYIIVMKRFLSIALTVARKSKLHLISRKESSYGRKVYM